MKRKTISKPLPLPTTCDPTGHNFVALEVTPTPTYNGGLGQLAPHNPRRFVLFCTRCAATKVIQ
jgi:hypothetical protein